MQEHGGQHGQDRREERFPSLTKTSEPAWHEAELQDEVASCSYPFSRAQALQGDLVEKDRDIDRYQTYCDPRGGKSRNVILERKHLKAPVLN